MRIKEILIGSFFLLFIVAQVAGQEKLPVNNANVRYEIWHYSMQLIDTNKAIPSKYVIAVSIGSNLKGKLKAFSAEQWLNWLEDNRTDWAANLLLYDLYERDAIVYKVVIKKRKDWLLAKKAEELEYWKAFLEKQ